MYWKHERLKVVSFFFDYADDNESEGTESDEKEVVSYSISSEVKFYNAKANRLVRWVLGVQWIWFHKK